MHFFESFLIWLSFVLQRGGLFYDHGKGKMVFGLAYSGGVLARCFWKGEFDVCFAYSGIVFSMTIEGVSFRTGLRG